MTETSTLFPIGYRNRLQPPVSVVIRGNYVTEVCICERDSADFGLVQRSFILSFPLLHWRGILQGLRGHGAHGDRRSLGSRMDVKKASQWEMPSMDSEAKEKYTLTVLSLWKFWIFLLQHLAIPCLLQRVSQTKEAEWGEKQCSKQKEQSDPEVRTMCKKLVKTRCIWNMK